MHRKLIVVDLDGTLHNTNTFHKWMIFLLKKTIRHNPVDSFKIIFYSLMRLLKRITHKQLKFEILKISESSSYAQYLNTFVEELHRYINPKVLDFIEKENSISILATAAPALYAGAIAEKYHIDYCIATLKTSEDEWSENIREEKKKSLERLLNKIGGSEVEIVLSDHYDDIPIMQMARKVYLVNGSTATKEKLKEAQISYIEF